MVVVHARNAWLKGLSPKENREVPPLKYDWAYRLKQERPALPVVLNGGLASVEAVQAQAAHVDGVMLGRAAYHDPCCISWRRCRPAPRCRPAATCCARCAPTWKRAWAKAQR